MTGSDAEARLLAEVDAARKRLISCRTAADVEAVMTAVDQARRELAALGAGPIPTAIVTGTLGGCWSCHFDVSSNRRSLERADGLLAGAVRDLPPGEEHRIRFLMARSAGLFQLAVLDQDPTALPAAAAPLRIAFSETPPGHPLRCDVCNNLAALLIQGYGVGHSDFRAEAETVLAEAFALAPATGQQAVAAQINSANLYFNDFLLGRDRTAAEQAWEHARQAVVLADDTDLPRAAQTASRIAAILGQTSVGDIVTRRPLPAGAEPPLSGSSTDATNVLQHAFRTGDWGPARALAAAAPELIAAADNPAQRVDRLFAQAILMLYLGIADADDELAADADPLESGSQARSRAAVQLFQHVLDTAEPGWINPHELRRHYAIGSVYLFQEAGYWEDIERAERLAQENVDAIPAGDPALHGAASFLAVVSEIKLIADGGTPSGEVSGTGGQGWLRMLLGDAGLGPETDPEIGPETDPETDPEIDS
jgi:hypothetical protein